MSRPFIVKIKNPGEIRMGSPYNLCEIELIGFEKIKLPVGGWQDKYAWSEDSKKLVLIEWNFESNEPGFHFYIINTESGNFEKTERISGLPNDVEIIGNKIRYNKFLLDRLKSDSNNLCCNFDEEYTLQ